MSPEELFSPPLITIAVSNDGSDLNLTIYQGSTHLTKILTNHEAITLAYKLLKEVITRQEPNSNEVRTLNPTS
jgi:phage-related protein